MCQGGNRCEWCPVNIGLSHGTVMYPWLVDVCVLYSCDVSMLGH